MLFSSWSALPRGISYILVRTSRLFRRFTSFTCLLIPEFHSAWLLPLLRFGCPLLVCLVFDMCFATAFDARIAKTLTVDDPNAHKWTVQLLSAMQYMAEKNMVHRDLKPENVLLDHGKLDVLCCFMFCVRSKYKLISNHRCGGQL